MSEQTPKLAETARHCREEAERPGSTPGHRRLFSGLARFYETLAEEEVKAGHTPDTDPPAPPKSPAH